MFLFNLFVSLMQSAGFSNETIATVTATGLGAVCCGFVWVVLASALFYSFRNHLGLREKPEYMAEAIFTLIQCGFFGSLWGAALSLWVFTTTNSLWLALGAASALPFAWTLVGGIGACAIGSTALAAIFIGRLFASTPDGGRLPGKPRA